MNCIRKIVNEIRPRRKYILNAGSLLMILLLLTTGIASRPPDEVDDNIKIDDDYPDVDNIEWHHVKLVDGAFEPDHPIIMYKEDFVNEDFDPSKKSTNTDNKSTIHGSKKYKDISVLRHQKIENQTKAEEYQIVKPEKIYFDVLPQSPVVVLDDIESSQNSKFDPSKIPVDLVPLVDDEDVKSTEESKAKYESSNEENLKELLSKKSKKFHRRVRRELNEEEHTVKKRNPYYNLHYVYDTRNYIVPQTAPQQQIYYPQVMYVRHPVIGQRQPSASSQNKIPMTIDSRFGDSSTIYFPDNRDTSIFGNQVSNMPVQRPVQRPTERPTEAPSQQRPTKRPVLNLSHDSNPANADFSGFDELMNTLQQQPQPSRPVRPGATTAPPRRQTSKGIPNCVWAIVNCCSNSREVRYSCFEEFGCTGVFWDLNPCADNIRRKVVNYVDDYYDYQ